MDVREQDQLTETILKEHSIIESIFSEMEKVIVGQKYLLERILIGLLANGHILIEGVPGLAKTLTVSTFSSIIHTKFQRIQFTPDMLPADLTGAPVYIQQTGTFETKKGPIFTNILLTDEINRASAKVQSALLEVMEERQVTIGETTYRLEDPFMVLATQNSIEQDGTHDLPESQLDRFMLKVNITYPNRAEELRIMRNHGMTQKNIAVKSIIDPQHILGLRKIIDGIIIEEKVENYILDIVEATRDPERFKLAELKEMIKFGGSPRATINLLLASKAHAFLKGRSYVTSEDVKAIGVDVLQHRIILSHQAETRGLDAIGCVRKILNHIPMP
ncbi:MAG: MoxR family ATPase [Candidatus Omnitrophica bacterium]|nr:MoxR family ATPase [Candidatus Omnitrophota bacterium]